MIRPFADACAWSVFALAMGWLGWRLVLFVYRVWKGV